VVAAHVRGLAIGVVRDADGSCAYSVVGGPGTWRRLRVRGSTAIDVTDLNAWAVSGTLAGTDGRSRAVVFRLPDRPGTP
jgi:hypothetical protein